ncbi:MAG: hypothetical protein KAT29_01060, partial [Anaerolineales bacterium]|nr:hypothetical protein [Anaerolineales bacterium]
MRQHCQLPSNALALPSSSSKGLLFYEGYSPEQYVSIAKSPSLTVDTSIAPWTFASVAMGLYNTMRGPLAICLAGTIEVIIFVSF